MNEDKILAKLEQHDRRFDAMDAKLEQHDRRFDAMDKKLEQHDKRFEAHDKQFDRVIETLLSHDGRLQRIEETMVTKKDWEIMMQGQDKMAVILERWDQERVFTNQTINRIQTELEEQKKKIGEHDETLKLVKVQLRIA